MADFGRVAPGEMLGAANLAAGQATVAWLLARGLVAEIEALRRRLPGPLVVPGVEELFGALGVAADDAGTAADALAESDLRAHDGLGLLHEVYLAAERADVPLRRLAQLTLGVSTHGSDIAAIRRAERAAVALLAGIFHEPASLADDGAHFVATSIEGWRVEIAGAICRMIIEQDWEIIIETGTMTIGISYLLSGDLVVSTGGSTPMLWSDPVRVVDVVDRVLDMIDGPAVPQVSVRPTSNQPTTSTGSQRHGSGRSSR
jgi:hypothetical protein